MPYCCLAFHPEERSQLQNCTPKRHDHSIDSSRWNWNHSLSQTNHQFSMAQTTQITAWIGTEALAVYRIKRWNMKSGFSACLFGRVPGGCSFKLDFFAFCSIICRVVTTINIADNGAASFFPSSLFGGDEDSTMLLLGCLGDIIMWDFCCLTGIVAAANVPSTMFGKSALAAAICGGSKCTWLE